MSVLRRPMPSLAQWAAREAVRSVRLENACEEDIKATTERLVAALEARARLPEACRTELGFAAFWSSLYGRCISHCADPMLSVAITQHSSWGMPFACNRLGATNLASRDSFLRSLLQHGSAFNRECAIPWLRSLGPLLVSSRRRFPHKDAFHWACRRGDLETAKWIFDQGMPLASVRHNNNSTLFHACQNGHEHVVKWLCTLGLKEFDVQQAHLTLDGSRKWDCRGACACWQFIVSPP